MPALGFAAPTRFYAPLLSLTLRETRLIEQPRMAAGHDDRVLASLVLHPLTHEQRLRALAAMRRWLGGELHLLSGAWGVLHTTRGGACPAVAKAGARLSRGVPQLASASCCCAS